MKDPVIGIIGGKGRMGGLFAKFFKDNGIKVLISDLKTELTNKKLAQSADIILFAVPIDKTEKTIKETLPFVSKKSALMDITSIKERPVEAMLKGKCEVLGMHPMFGDSNPIPGQTIILCPTKKSGPWSKWMEAFLKKHDVTIEKMSSREHDKMMNIAQGLIHFADIAFADALRQLDTNPTELRRFTGKSSELKLILVGRLIDQDPSLYANIQIQNPQALNSLKVYRDAFNDLFNIVKKKDSKAFEKYFLKSQKFLGKYRKTAYKESTYLIDKLIQYRKRPELDKKDSEKPTLKHLAVLGPKFSYSDLAAEKYLQSDGLRKYYARDIEEVFELVEKGKVKQGIAPIENKLHGTVRETLDNLFSRDVHIIKQINIPIDHCLITLPKTRKSDVKTVISHSQALHQCKKYLRKHFPDASIQSYSSTSAAIEKLMHSADNSIAVIAHELSAQNYDLKILSRDIANEEDNNTTFVIIEKGKFSPVEKASKTSIAFHFDEDSPGSLFSVFEIFAKAKINLTKIESRPTRSEFGDYIFYMDFDGSTKDPNVAKCLHKVASNVAYLKVLGSY